MSKDNLKSSFTYRIYYEDTDSGGVVYYANYLKFFERGRTDFLRVRGINQLQLAIEEDTVFLVKKVIAEYKAPAVLDDLITVNTKVVNIGAAFITMEQEMFNQNNNLLNIVQIQIACVSRQKMKPKKIPEKILKLIQK